MTSGPTSGPDEDATTRMPRVEGAPADHDSPTGPLPAVPAEPPAASETRIGDEARTGESESTDRAERSMPTLLEQMGGISGIVASSLPIGVFIVANLIAGLKPALIAAIAAAVVVAVVRVVRKQPLQPAVSGFIGVGVCAFIAYRTGEARGFYLPGLLYSAALGLAFLVSIIVRRPLAGVIWHGINGHGQGWRRNPRMLKAYTWASALWVVVFGARVVVQGLLYNADEETWLGIARLAMGYPLIGLAILGTVLAVRRAERPAQV